MERAPVLNIVTLASRDRIKLDLEAENNFRFHEVRDFAITPWSLRLTMMSMSSVEQGIACSCKLNHLLACMVDSRIAIIS